MFCVVTGGAVGRDLPLPHPPELLPSALNHRSPFSVSIKAHQEALLLSLPKRPVAGNVMIASSFTLSHLPRRKAQVIPGRRPCTSSHAVILHVAFHNECLSHILYYFCTLYLKTLNLCLR